MMVCPSDSQNLLLWHLLSRGPVVVRTRWHADMLMYGSGNGERGTSDLLEPFSSCVRMQSASLPACCSVTFPPVFPLSLVITPGHVVLRRGLLLLLVRIHCGENSKSNGLARASGSYL